VLLLKTKPTIEKAVCSKAFACREVMETEKMLLTAGAKPLPLERTLHSIDGVDRIKYIIQSYRVLQM
jgi:hypothetical protein